MEERGVPQEGRLHPGNHFTEDQCPWRAKNILKSGF